MKTLVALVLLLASSLSLADNRSWTGEEKAWLGTAVAFTVTDWATTRDLSRRYNEGYYETNPILGKHPSTDRVDLHFISAGVAGYFLADYLDEWRLPWLRIWTTAGIYYTNRNLNLGLNIKF